MNICMLTPTYLPTEGGTQRAIKSLAGALARRGHCVTVVTPDEHMFGNTSQHGAQFHVIRFPFSRARGCIFLTQNARCFLQVLEQHRSEAFDYLHLFHVVSFGISSILLKKVVRTPLITTLMGDDSYSWKEEIGQQTLSYRFTRPYASWIMNSSDLVTAPSQNLTHHAHVQGCKREIVVIPHGVDPERFDPAAVRRRASNLRARLGLRDREHMILTVQRLIKRKDLETVILAMPKILQEKPNVKLVVVGEGPERERLLRLASTTGVASSVIFAGSVPESEKPSYYGAADLFLLSTLYEAFGLVLVEAMAAAKCVIASKTGAVPEIVQDQVTGFVFPPGRVQDLAVLVLRALEDDTLRTEMGLRGRERALANYSWDRITERYCAAYAQLR